MKSETEMAAHVLEIAGKPPEWVHLIPSGRFQGRDGRGPYHLSDPEAVIASSRALQMDLPIDYDHALDFTPLGTPKPAAGWILSLESRPDGIWGRVNWTPKAATAIQEREYRYLSPIFSYRRKTGEVISLERAGLTNAPNLVLKAIASRAIHQEGTMDLLKKLIEMLGMAADSDEKAVMGKIKGMMGDEKKKATMAAQAARFTELIERAKLTADASSEAVAQAIQAQSADPVKSVPADKYEELSTEFASFKADVLTERATAKVDGAVEAGRIQPSQREWALAYCTKDPEGFTNFLAKQPQLTGKSGLGDRDPENKDPKTLTAQQQKIADAFGNTCEDLNKYAPI